MRKVVVDAIVGPPHSGVRRVVHIFATAVIHIRDCRKHVLSAMCT